MYLFTAYRLLLGAMALSFACLSLVGGMLYAFQIKWLYGTTVYYFILLLYRYHCPNDELHVLAMFSSVLEFVCLPWSEVCSARVTSLLLLLLLFMS